MKPLTVKPKVVIVEDQPEIRLLIKLTLDSNRYDFFEASDAQMGFNLVEKVMPDLILLDVMMPGEIDGLMLCDMLKSTDEYAHIPIIFLTGADSSEDHSAAMKSGASYYLLKPFLPQQLVELTDLIIKLA
jgi:two-component system phosphate regulon response regulator PhoB